MANGATAIMEQVESSQKAMFSAYGEGDLDFANNLMADIFLQLNSYVTAATFEAMRDQFDEDFAAALPAEGSSPLPKGITSQRDQIVNLLAGVDGQAESGKYNEAISALNALFTGNLVELQKAAKSYAEHYQDYSKGLDDIKQRHELYMVNSIHYPKTLGYLDTMIVDAHKAMEDAAGKGDYETAAEQKDKLDSALKQADKGLAAHLETLRSKYDERRKELGKRFDELPEVGGGASDGPPSSEQGESTDDSHRKLLQSLSDDILNGFNAAAQEVTSQAMDANFKAAMEELDKVEKLIEEYETENKSHENAEEEAHYKDLYEYDLEQLNPQLVAAVPLPFEVLTPEHSAVPRSLAAAEAKAADGKYKAAQDLLSGVRYALKVYRDAIKETERLAEDHKKDFKAWKKESSKLVALRGKVKIVDLGPTSYEPDYKHPNFQESFSETEEEVLELEKGGYFGRAKEIMDEFLKTLEIDVYPDVEADELLVKNVKDVMQEKMTISITKLKADIGAARTGFEDWYRTLPLYSDPYDTADAVFSFLTKGLIECFPAPGIAKALANEALEAALDLLAEERAKNSEATRDRIGAAMTGTVAELDGKFAGFADEVMAKNKKIWLQLVAAKMADNEALMTTILQDKLGLPDLKGGSIAKLKAGMIEAYTGWCKGAGMGEQAPAKTPSK